MTLLSVYNMGKFHPLIGAHKHTIHTLYVVSFLPVALSYENNSQFIYLFTFSLLLLLCVCSFYFICSLGLIKSHTRKRNGNWELSLSLHIKIPAYMLNGLLLLPPLSLLLSMHWIQLCSLCALVVVAIYSVFFLHFVHTHSLSPALSPPLCHLNNWRANEGWAAQSKCKRRLLSKIKVKEKFQNLIDIFHWFATQFHCWTLIASP